jgi:hypothetical protein
MLLISRFWLIFIKMFFHLSQTIVSSLQMYRWKFKIVKNKKKAKKKKEPKFRFNKCENEIKKTLTIEVGAWHEIMAFIKAKSDEHIATLDKIDPCWNHSHEVNEDFYCCHGCKFFLTHMDLFARINGDWFSSNSKRYLTTVPEWFWQQIVE